MAEGWEKVIGYQKQGKILAQGMFAGRKGGCVIWDVESVEELHTLISQSPIFPFLETETTPLVSIERALESVKSAQEKEQTPKE
ncbi:methylmuconolactone isomerase [Desulfosporosinus sp. OT]|nr:methylmuconolactone isomerase [Desulfosporosinus sp. OT]